MLTTSLNFNDGGEAKEHLVTRAREILLDAPSVHIDTTNEEIRLFFASHPEMEVVAVVGDDGQPSGLINRFIFAESFSRPFAREVYGKRSCIAWMDKDPLVMDEDTVIEILVKAAVAKGPKVLKDGFIGTREKRYIGQGTGFSLLKAMESLEAEKTRQLLESIDYASAIQRSHLRNSDCHLAAALEDSFLHWAPRDVVGGDCYFFRQTPEGLFGAIVDCTGHGVPGAFMSLITLSYLSFLLGTRDHEVDPGEVLSRLNRHIKEVLAQGNDGELAGRAEGDGRASDDGMDVAAFLLAPDGRSLQFAGARMPLIVMDAAAGASLVLEAERMGVGYVRTPDEYRWESQRVALPATCRVMIPTDGITDQVGGPRGISMGRKRMVEWLDGASGQSAAAIGRDFLAHFQEWQGDQVRRDDATFLVFTPR
jgi:serine phosphatase RsbU (regulator of sigma subunit)